MKTRLLNSGNHHQGKGHCVCHSNPLYCLCTKVYLLSFWLYWMTCEILVHSRNWACTPYSGSRSLNYWDCQGSHLHITKFYMHIPVAKIILSGIHTDICAFAWVSKCLPRNPQELLCRGDYRHDLYTLCTTLTLYHV